MKDISFLIFLLVSKTRARLSRKDYGSIEMHNYAVSQDCV